MSEELEGKTVNEDGISAAISKLMAHPEIIQNVAAALAADVPPAEQGKDKGASTADTPGDLAASLMPVISRLGAGLGGGGESASRHSALLCALKPYLSERRQNALDSILKISQMSALISKLR